MRQNVIGILGNYCAGNLGDDAILEGLLGLLRGAGHKGEVMVYCYDPTPLSRQEGVRPIPMRRWNFSAMVKQARQLSGLMIGGGGLLADYSLLWTTKFFLRAAAARLAGCRVMLCAAGVGPLKTRVGRWQTKVIASLADILSVRDAVSATLLRDLGVKKAIHVVPDPAFLIQPPADKTPIGGREALWAIRPWPPVGKTPTWLAPQLARSADCLSSKLDLGAAFVPFYRGYDEPFCSQVHSLMQMSGAAQNLTHPASLAEALTLIAASPIVVSMRLHALIFAALVGTPCVAVACDAKLRILMESLGLASFALPLDPDMQPEMFVTTCLRSIEEHRQRRAEIGDRVQRLRDQAWRLQELLRHFLDLCGAR